MPATATKYNLSLGDEEDIAGIADGLDSCSVQDVEAGLQLVADRLAGGDMSIVVSGTGYYPTGDDTWQSEACDCPCCQLNCGLCEMIDDAFLDDEQDEVFDALTLGDTSLVDAIIRKRIIRPEPEPEPVQEQPKIQMPRLTSAATQSSMIRFLLSMI